MKAWFLILSIILLALGHYFKTKRWKQFVEIYEEPKEKLLLRSLSLGYIINYYIPFRIGDLFRAFYSGKKMKNGISFSLATIIVDRYLDILIVGIIFLVFLLTGLDSKIIVDSAIFYVIISIILFLLAIIAINKSKIFKIIMKYIASIFNSKIELRILTLSWCFISSFKDIYKKLSRKKLFFNTILMWSFYLLSYYFFALYISYFSQNLDFIGVFNLLFAKNNLDVAMSTASFGMSNLPFNFSIIVAVYTMAPLFLLILLSYLPLKNRNVKSNNSDGKYLHMLPHKDLDDKLVFLEAYFSGNSREYFNNYLKINRDISILQDYSSGSSATTMLCTDGQNMFFRKYAFGDSGEKLYDQVKWLHKNENVIKLTSIMKEGHGNGYCYYDMPYNQKALGFFNYVHSTPIHKSWELLETVLNDVENRLYNIDIKKSDKKTLKKYIDTKILSNIEKIETAKELKSLMKYDRLIINGKSYNNLNYYKKYLNFEYLYEIFKNDTYSEIHGDLTIENIIILPSNIKKDDYYIIDPNTGNVHNSPNLDYAKLLQSLHGGYEFLMNTKNVNVKENNIYFLHTKSMVYDELYKLFKAYLKNKFPSAKVKSIYFHEVVHWLRLMPYKIEKNGQRAVIFYAEMIRILNEVGELYGK